MAAARCEAPPGGQHRSGVREPVQRALRHRGDRAAVPVPVRSGYDGHTTVVLFSYGRQVNAVDPATPVVAQRDSALKSYLGTYGTDPDGDERHIRRLREFCRELYAETDGVPVSDAHTDGSYINYPDVDLADPRWNTSGVPWHALYFKGNDAGLQRVKAVWDPQDVFRHTLSVRASD
ncbi:BBE domain-containing protein [Streptomyces sp. NPDC056656]|uniref:BBE domain-containing protein n=1 Tax=Streptomyces sp. NPDC056656 TaxID=3345895 RepID=UPI00369BCD02